MSAEFKWDEKTWNNFVRRVEKNVSKPVVDAVLNSTANYAKGVLARKTLVESKSKGKTLKIGKRNITLPNMATGETSKKWHVVRKKFSEYEVINTSKVALFLEEGTRAHGPKTSKYLYIPLRPNARTWNATLIRGLDYILTKRVKGIDAMNYLEPSSQEVLKVMTDNFTKQLQKIGA